MPKVIYNWKRFWCPREGRVSLADDGFLVDPDSELAIYHPSDVVSFQSIAPTPCLGLLGEPGSGKSTALEREWTSVRAAISGTEDDTMWVDLREYSSDQRLSQKVFSSPQIQKWRQGAYTLHLFFDSLDESLLRIDNISDVLRSEMRDLPTARLRIRIACRTADWPASLESALSDIWGETGFGAFELVPLRKCDVIEAARSTGVNGERFLNAVIDLNVAPLAIQPVTLRFLLSAYQRGQALPANRQALYAEGCKCLCEEPIGQGELTASQRYEIAGRLAAVTQFANRYAIWTGRRLDEIPPEDVLLELLIGGTEGESASSTQVDAAGVKEVLGTGLFSARGLHRLGWAHQTYAEFLAAGYLLAHKMSTRGLLQLILHPDGSGKIVPQLREVAAWLGTMSVDVFRALAKTDPETLIRSGISGASNQDRAELAKTLLASFELGDIVDDQALHQFLPGLNNPDLASVVRPYIADTARCSEARRAAISIAAACRLTELQGDLIAVALDASEVGPIRIRAAATLSEIGDTVARGALRPLALGTAGSDPDDELKGWGLKATWPDALTAEELFVVLTPQKKPNLFGSYWHFLFSDPVRALSADDLVIALEWAEVRDVSYAEVNPMAKIVAGILNLALGHLDKPKVPTLVAQALSRQWHFFAGSNAVTEKLMGSDSARHCVARAMLPIVSGDPHAALILMDACCLTRRDVPWLLSELSHTPDTRAEEVIAWIVSRCLDPDDVEAVDAVIRASSTSPALLKEIRPWIAAVPLNSPEATQIKSEFLQFQKYQKSGQPIKRPPAPPDPEALEKILSKATPDAFFEIWCACQGPAGIDPTAASELLRGWSEMDAAIRLRILEVAKTYLTNPHTLGAIKWWKEGRYSYYEIAGYYALRLLYVYAPNLLTELSADQWERWARIAVCYPFGGETNADRSQLVRLVYEKAADTVLETIDEVIEGENERHGMVLIFQHLGGIWDSRVRNIARDRLKCGVMKPQAFRHLLGELLDSGDVESRSFAESLVSGAIPESGDQRALIVGAASELMGHTSDAAWTLIWPIIEGNKAFGTEVVQSVGLGFASKLKENQIAELYIWLLPKDSIPKADEDVPMDYNTLAQMLASRGTPEGSLALRRVLGERPQFEGLKWYIEQSEELARRNTWTPATPDEVIQLASDASARLVRNERDLVDVLVESLERLEATLQGETPAAIDIWSDVVRAGAAKNEKTVRPKKLFRPKEEVALSDYVKRHLDRDLRDRGIIINREVEIRRPMGGAQGERTDVHVNVALPTSDPNILQKVTVIIEVKGCWNPDLDTAMQTQLVERYMKDTECHYGIYLVGWFACLQWDPTDPRQGKTPKISIEDARRQFQDQAAKLSGKGQSVLSVVLNVALR